jgi:hypothetical protein
VWVDDNAEQPAGCQMENSYVLCGAITAITTEGFAAGCDTRKTKKFFALLTAYSRRGKKHAVRKTDVSLRCYFGMKAAGSAAHLLRIDQKGSPSKCRCADTAA